MASYNNLYSGTGSLNSTWPPANTGNFVNSGAPNGSYYTYNQAQNQGQQLNMNPFNPGPAGPSNLPQFSNSNQQNPSIANPSYGLVQTHQSEIADFNSPDDIGPPLASSTLRRRKKKNRPKPNATIVGYTEVQDPAMEQYPKLLRKPIARLLEWWNDSNGPVYRLLVYMGEIPEMPNWGAAPPLPPGGMEPLFTESFFQSAGIGNVSDLSLYTTANNDSFFSATENTTGESNASYGGSTEINITGYTTGPSYISATDLPPVLQPPPSENNPYANDYSWWRDIPGDPRLI